MRGGYGDEEFIKAFKDKLGAHYLRDHENGLRRFLKTIRGEVSPAIEQLETVRRDLEEKFRKHSIAE